MDTLGDLLTVFIMAIQPSDKQTFSIKKAHEGKVYPHEL